MKSQSQPLKNTLLILFTVFFSLFIYGSAWAQNATGIVKGNVKTADNQPAEFVSVAIKTTTKGAITNSQGDFVINKVTPGIYTLVISFVGLETIERQIEVKAGETTNVPAIQLNENAKTLNEVVIKSNRNKFSQKESDNIARMPLKNLENPQVYSVVGKDLMKEQVVIERTDLYRNVPGAVPNFLAGGSQGMTTRGFQSTVGMRNGLITSAIFPLNPVILERVEVLKGPSGTLFGGNRNTTFGGLFNYVTKKPYDNFGGEINYTAGSFDLSRISADINAPINADKTALIRVNTAWQSEGSFQDQGFAKNYTFAPTFSYQVNDKLKFLVDVDITRNSYTTSSIAIGAMQKVTARNFHDLKLGYERSLINNTISIQNGVNNLGGEIQYKFSDKWKSETKYLYSEGFYENLLWTTFSMLTDSTIARTVRNQTPETFGNIQFQQNFIGDFKIGSLRNRMVIGADYSLNYNSLNRVTVNYDTVNINKPIKDFNADKISELSSKKGFVASTFESETYGLYISDVVNFTPSLMVMASLRLDKYTTDGDYALATGEYKGAYDQTSLSPKLGLVYQPVKEKVSVFANYMNGFMNLAPVNQPDKTVLELKPQYANQWEAGLKVNIIKNKLNSTISYYDISVTNSTRTEVIDGLNFTVQDGTQNSKGLEVELIASPIAGLNIIAGYANNQNKYTKASAAIEGKSLAASPEHAANLWASYVLSKGKIQGLGFGVGGNYVSESWFESSNTFVLPSYTLVNATVFYDQPKYRIAVKGNNLLNEQYWNSNGTPQKPINFLTSASFKF